jgi:hypothetical protein
MGPLSGSMTMAQTKPPDLPNWVRFVSNIFK